MKYSKLFTKTIKDTPKDETSVNAIYLLKAGYIYKDMAGAYSFLPLGLKVLDKIINIIREEMNKIDGQEVNLSSLQPKELWEKSDRWDDKKVDVWFKSKLKVNDNEIGFAWTHEEVFTSIMKKYIKSYKDLPVYAYQFQSKFRNEERSKSGILRTREFIMKDLYSFNKDEESLNEYYEKVKQAYVTIFNRLGIGDKTFVTFASGGAFSKFSHEFQTICEAGEDIIYVDDDKKLAVNKEVYVDEVLNELNLDKSKLKEAKAIEVGNIFKLKTRFSDPLDLTYASEEGTNKKVYMGSYGIGPARVMGTIVELSHDDKGIIWPDQIAPFKVHLISLAREGDEVTKEAEKLYQDLTSKGIDVLFDDRTDVSAGEKFADADLIGIPYRVVISQKSITAGGVEIKKRREAESKIIAIEDLRTYI